MSAFKLGMLAIRTLAKPVTNSLKRGAKENPTFRALCISIAQRLHRTEVKLRTGPLHENVSTKEMRPLNEAKAIDAGADFLAEAFTFGVAASILIYEQYRSRRDANKRKEYVDESLSSLESSQARIDGLAADLSQIKETLEAMKETNVLIAEGLARLAQAEKANQMVMDRVDKVMSLKSLFDGTGSADPRTLVVNLEPGNGSGAVLASDAPQYLQKLNASLGIGAKDSSKAGAGHKPTLLEEALEVAEVVGLSS